MSVARSADQEAPLKRRPWEPPAISELSLRTAATPTGVGPASPPGPRGEPPLTKLGFAFEASFPLSARTET